MAPQTAEEAKAGSTLTTISSRPQNLAVTDATPYTLTLTWDAPADNGGLTIDGYHIYRTTTNRAVTEADRIGSVEGGVFTFLVDGLNRGTTYYFHIGAVNSIGEQLSNIASGATLALVPTPPRNVAFSGVSSDTFTVGWEASEDDGGAPITRYDIFYSTENGQSELPSTDAVASQTSTTLGGLTRFTEYYVYIEAVNRVGASEPSEVGVVKTLSTVPDFPITLQADALSSSQIRASWAAPVDNGGLDIEQYHVYLSETSVAPAAEAVSVEGLEHTFDGLTRATRYFVWVQAENADGRGPLSAVDDAVTFPEAPSAPGDLVFNHEYDANQVLNTARIGFKFANDDATNGGAAVSAFRLYIAPSGATDYDNPLWFKEESVDTSSLNFTIYGNMFHADTNQIWVTAVNEAGESDRSEIYQGAAWLCPKCAVCDTACYGRKNNNVICPPVDDPWCLA